MNSTVSFRILQANEADAHAITQYVIPTMAQLYVPGGFNADPDDLKYFDKVYVQSPDACFYVAVDNDGHIVGTAAIRPYDGRFPFMKEYLDDRKVCEVTKVYIDGRYRRQGIGTALYEAVENYAREVGYATSYLHNTTTLPGGYPFWLFRGYRVRYEEAGSIVHMTKTLV